MSLSTDLQNLLDTLATQRDELIVQAHLAKLEAEEDWLKLEQQLEHLRAKASQAGAVGVDTARDVLAAAKLAGEEIARGYERLRRTL
ncbi:MAG: hypothetical protein ACSLFJ_11715 [Immundisolibacter sp.]|uniref:hypothetical protein n=1 Tax=Immundisolibacter sp. TaxID=1934948 RepID=UPI003EE3C0A0